VNLGRIGDIASQIATLKSRGKSVTLVSSGAVAAGSAKLNMDKRPEELRLIQATAAVGQGKLMRYYSEAFAGYDIPVGQMLLTRDGFDDRTRYLNARNTLHALLELGCVPIVNENDTVMVEEIQFGDNDQLSSMVAGIAEADCLVILSDIEGLHEKPPAEGESPVIKLVEEITPEIEALAGISHNGVGKGGMASKLAAAKRATENGANVIIASGQAENIITDIFDGKDIGTLFTATDSPRSARKKWISGCNPTGTVTVDSGARKAIEEKGKSLLPIGMLKADNHINKGDTVNIAGQSGEPFALGIVNFNGTEMNLIAKKPSEDIAGIIDGCTETTVIHRDNLVLMN
jgi:glutamate 5-kinase